MPPGTGSWSVVSHLRRGRPHHYLPAAAAIACVLLIAPFAGCGSAGAPAEPSPTVATGGVWEDITPPISLDPTDFNNNNYGTLTIVAAPSDPGIVYLGTCNQGIWRTEDRGETWDKVSTGRGGANLETGRNWTMAVDPNDAETIYTVAGFGEDQGIWKSTDGGRNWRQLMPASMAESATLDVYSIAVDPTDPAHLLAGSHSGWAGNESSGVFESADGGTTWVLHQPEPSWGTGHYVFFLDSTTWLLATQTNGFWRTEDSGSTWEQVSEISMSHGGDQLYRTAEGVLFIGANNTLLMSEDDGRSWTSVGPSTSVGYYAVIGDGQTLYAQPSSTGDNYLDDDPPYFVSAEDDGTEWVPMNPDQVFTNGPMSMAFDPISQTIYSSNWNAGVWRFELPDR